MIEQQDMFQEIVSSKYIGEKKIRSVRETEEKTPGGLVLVEVEYEDGNKEWVSPKMFVSVVSEKPCNASELREKRITPVVQDMMVMLREWGIKLGELPYLSALLNQSLDYNSKEALLELWAKWMPKPLSADDVDLVTIDRVLKTIEEKRLTMKDVIGKPDDGPTTSP